MQASGQHYTGHQKYSTVIIAPGSVSTFHLTDENLWGWKCRRGMGITQIICGVVEIAMGISAIGLPVGGDFDKLDFIGWGIWIGVFVIVTGCLGFHTKRRKSMVTAYMITSIIAAVMGAGLAAYALYGFVWSVFASLAYEYNTYPFDDYTMANIAVYITLATFSGVQCVISIIGASFTCRAFCSAKDHLNQNVYTQSSTTPYTLLGQVPPYSISQDSPPPYNLAYTPSIIYHADNVTDDFVLPQK